MYIIQTSENDITTINIIVNSIFRTEKVARLQTPATFSYSGLIIVPARIPLHVVRHIELSYPDSSVLDKADNSQNQI